MRRIVVAITGLGFVIINPTARAVEDAPLLWNSSYFANWTSRVVEAQQSQPHWIAPLATVTPLLVQQVRYDQFWEHLGTGANINNYNNGHGLELIPTTTNEVLLNCRRISSVA